MNRRHRAKEYRQNVNILSRFANFQPTRDSYNEPMLIERRNSYRLHRPLFVNCRCAGGDLIRVRALNMGHQGAALMMPGGFSPRVLHLQAGEEELELVCQPVRAEARGLMSVVAVRFVADLNTMRRLRMWLFRQNGKLARACSRDLAC